MTFRQMTSSIRFVSWFAPLPSVSSTWDSTWHELMWRRRGIKWDDEMTGLWYLAKEKEIGKGERNEDPFIFFLSLIYPQPSTISRQSLHHTCWTSQCDEKDNTGRERKKRGSISLSHQMSAITWHQHQPVKPGRKDSIWFFSYSGCSSWKFNEKGMTEEDEIEGRRPMTAVTCHEKEEDGDSQLNLSLTLHNITRRIWEWQFVSSFQPCPFLIFIWKERKIEKK